MLTKQNLVDLSSNLINNLLTDLDVAENNIIGYREKTNYLRNCLEQAIFCCTLDKEEDITYEDPGINLYIAAEYIDEGLSYVDNNEETYEGKYKRLVQIANAACTDLFLTEEDFE